MRGGCEAGHTGTIIFQAPLNRLFTTGRLTVLGLGRRPLVLGDAHSAAPEPDVVVRVRDRLTAARIAFRPDPCFGEAYMDGSLAIERGDLWALFDLCGRNFASTDWRAPRLPPALRRALRLLRQVNLRGQSRRNVAHHYDLSETLFRSFLDPEMHYSCAYFRSPEDPLEQAQAAKVAHIAAKLLLRPGLRVLDIGCGWGGLAIALARLEEVEVTGITLSAEQARLAQKRVEAAGLAGRVRIALGDYRDIRGQFDRIVSVGMFEHVGVPHYGTFFDVVGRALAPDGVALVHAIGRRDGPAPTPAWTRTYIFPGGYIPALSEVLPVVERTGFWVTDLEILRLHYAETLRRWRERFLANLSAVRERHDERFCRMWEFFLAGSEYAFRYDALMVFQMQLAKRRDAVPLTREYLDRREQALRERLAAPRCHRAS